MVHLHKTTCTKIKNVFKQVSKIQEQPEIKHGLARYDKSLFYIRSDLDLIKRRLEKIHSEFCKR